MSTHLIKPNYLVILPPTQLHSFFRNLPPLYIYDYKDSLSPDVLLVRSDLSTGFSDEVIEQILKVCDVVNTAKDIMDKIDLWEEKQALYVYL